MDSHEGPQRLVAALTEIDEAARENIVRNEAIQARVQYLLERITTDTSLKDLLATLPGPLIVELVSANIERLQESGSRLRTVQAEALRGEGLTLQEIADLFGVSRQRISAVLNRSAPDDAVGTT